MTDSVSLLLESVLAKFVRMVRAAGARHGLNDRDIDELVQEVRIRLWRAHPDSEEIARLPSSYVYRTALTAAVDLVRKRRREQDREPSLEETPSERFAARARADENTLESDLGQAVAKALETMIEARRVVVRLHLSGYEREEMARLLGWSEGSCRNLLYRGLQDLRVRLTQAGYRWPEDS